MKNIMRSGFRLLLASVMLGGCASYRWSSTVPEELRTIAVPVFENRTMDAELGPIATQYTLREFQREGTFKIKRQGDSALEVQGVIISAGRSNLSYDRQHGYRASEYGYTVTAEVTLVNKKSGKVLYTRKYVAESSFLTQNDLLTGQRNAAPRIGHELGRQIVDDAIAYPFDDDKPEGASGKIEGKQL